MFDEFMRELAERQRRAEGAQRKEPAETDGEAGEPEASQVAEEVGEPSSQEAPVASDETGDSTGGEPAAEPAEAPTGEATPPEEREEPLRPAFGGRRGGRGPSGGGRPPRGPGGGGPRGPRDPGERRSLRARIARVGPQVLLVTIGVILLAAVLLVGTGIDLVTDAEWFKSIGFDGVFWTRLGGQVGLFILGLVIALVFFGGNLWLAGRLAPPPGTGGDRIRAWAARVAEAARGSADTFGGRDAFSGIRRPPFGPGGGPDDGARGRPTRPIGTPSFSLDDMPDLTPLAGVALAILAILAALGTAGTLSGNWETVTLWQHRVPFATDGTIVPDPVFGRDVAFYLLELPFLRLVRGLVSGLLLVGLGLSLARYLVGVLRGGGFPTPVRVHLGVLAGAFLLTVAAGYQLDKLGLVYSTHGVVSGVSYTDQAARFFAFDALTIVSGVVGVLLVFAAFSRWIWPIGAGVAVWLGLSILLGGLYPEAIQRFTVDPNQYAQEQPYIQNNIAMTTLSYGIGGWTTQNYRGDAALTAQAIQDEAGTFQNARLWDYRPLQTTLDQLQTVRQYYDFVDVDTDRYQINGSERQVMLGARELAPERNQQATSWVNQKIVFTHGFGIAMVPVNEVDAQGLPRLIIRDLPPVASAGAPAVNQPRIYFGERPNDWVIVGARQPEFDYPLGNVPAGSAEQQTVTNWTGTTGIKLDSVLTRLLFAARFRDLNLLISDQITSSSQLLMRRSLGERLAAIAPFLVYDKDPYLVVTGDGRLVYVQDAYTVSDQFPNAQPFDSNELGQGSGFAGASVNYVRNSVKVVMDAYDGSMSFYVNDPTDPLIRAWSGVFPDLFKSLDAMPEGLRPHLRVPEELFNIQTSVYGRYHVTDTNAFYQGNDLWTVPTSQTGADTGQLPLEAYYVTMRMPGKSSPEFLLLQPMVPRQRPNMIAWVAARNDGAERGTVKVFQFPRESSIFGPAQIQARITQDPVISAQVSLWDQAGSNVVYGNLIVVPVQDSIIYLEPIYLQATGAAIPEFTKIVVASPTTVAWGNSLGEALTTLLAGGTGGLQPGPSPTPGGTPVPTPTPAGTPGPLPSDVGALVQYANQHYEAAQAALRAGDFATYGVEIAKVQDALKRLSALTATPPPATPAPVVTPAPGGSQGPVAPTVTP